MRAILTIIMITFMSCNGGSSGGGSSDASPESNVTTPVDESVAVKPPFQAAIEVVIYPLGSKYLNGLREVSGAINELTLGNWEGLCETENPTNKEYAYPMASVNIVEMNGFVAEDQDHATYIRDNWYYGIDMSNTDVLDENGAVISTNLNWLINQNTAINFDFMPATAALYIGNKIISAGHKVTAGSTTVGTLLYNAGNLQAMFSSTNTVEVNYYCVAF